MLYVVFVCRGHDATVRVHDVSAGHYLGCTCKFS